MAEVEKDIAATLDTIKSERTKYEALISSDDERALYNQFAGKFENYLRDGERMPMSARNAPFPPTPTLSRSCANTP